MEQGGAMGRTFVVSIGVKNAPQSDLADLRFARADAEAIAGALSHPDRGVAASGNWRDAQRYDSSAGWPSRASPRLTRLALDG